MKIDKISYQKIFPTGMAYLNHKIGVEIQLDEGDSETQVFLHAKSLVEQWNIESNPSYAAAMEYMKPSDKPYPYSGIEMPSGLEPTKEQGMIDLINSKYQTKKTLENLRPQVEAMNNIEITELFNNRLKSFE